MKKIPCVSIGFVCINVAVYFVDKIAGGQLLQLGNLNLSDVLMRGEYLRLLWAMFLHGDLSHLFHNMVVLLFMGAVLEQGLGHILFGCVYLGSGVFGNICSLWYKYSCDRLVWSIGASGAVFGLDGLLLALVLFERSNMPYASPKRVLLMIALSVYNGLVSMNIDNAAHIGGLVCGFFLGCLICVIKKICKVRKER